MPHRTPGIISKKNVRVGNFGVKGGIMTLLKSAPILQPSYLNLQTERESFTALGLFTELH